jgi:Skp family chaperone for outer membrane proteins
MGFFTNVEQAAASKLKQIFLDSKKLVDNAENEIASLEAKLAEERQRVADLAHKAHADAVTAACKAQAEAEALMAAAKEAADRAAKHTAAVPEKVAPTLDPVEPAPAPEQPAQ